MPLRISPNSTLRFPGKFIQPLLLAAGLLSLFVFTIIRPDDIFARTDPYLRQTQNLGEGSITIIKDADPADGRNFAFTTNARSPATFLQAWGTFGNTAWQFDRPQGAAADGNGNIYIADTGNGRIQKFDSRGTYLLSWGKADSGDRQYFSPAGVAVDATGNVYVADLNLHRVQKFTGDGTFLRMWGWGVDTGAAQFEICTPASLPCLPGLEGDGDGQFAFPHDVAAATDGSIYVTDSHNDRVQKYDGSGAFLLKWGTEGSGEGQFYSPDGIAVDSAGNVYVADFRIQKFDSSGTFLLAWMSGDGQYFSPAGVAVDPTGHVYVADLHHRVQKFTGDGTFLRMWGWGVDTGAAQFEICTPASLPCRPGLEGGGDGQFFWPKGIAADAAGRVYVADTFNHRIQKFAGGGNFLEKWQRWGNGAGQFYFPRGVAADTAGNLYVSDNYNRRIQKFTSNGVFLRMWGWGVDTGAAQFEICTPASLPCRPGLEGNGDGQFTSLGAVAVDNEGTLYVIDQGSQGVRIQKFDSNGNFLLKWGNYDPFFQSLNGIAVDNIGNVYLTLDDRFFPGVHKYDGDGNLLLTWGRTGNGDGQFNNPGGVAADASGDVYVVDSANARIQKFDSEGKFLLKWGSYGEEEGAFLYPHGVTVDPAGHVYVTDWENLRIQKFDRDGIFLYLWGSEGNGEGEFALFTEAAADIFGNLFVADTFNHRIQKFSTNVFSLDKALPDDSDLITASVTFTNLVQGSYAFTETLPSGWFLRDITCDAGDWVIDFYYHSLSVSLPNGQHLTCIFHNRTEQGPKINLPSLLR